MAMGCGLCKQLNLTTGVNPVPRILFVIRLDLGSLDQKIAPFHRIRRSFTNI